jgi:hypothetical protein
LRASFRTLFEASENDVLEITGKRPPERSRRAQRSDV